VLFSEQKIPQYLLAALPADRVDGFSALQRAENSSIADGTTPQTLFISFSALQRAENSSIQKIAERTLAFGEFQCSSASRKFLNKYTSTPTSQPPKVSVLFSEPKIPQCLCSSANARGSTVSVLFSEPKIPQYISAAVTLWLSPRFSALQRAENSSICRRFSSTTTLRVSVLFSEPKIPQCEPQWVNYVAPIRFSALQRAENSSICPATAPHAPARRVSVLFSEPKIPQCLVNTQRNRKARRFSALQRAENSSIDATASGVVNRQRVSVLFSEPKIPQYYRRGQLVVEHARFQCSSASRKFLNPAAAVRAPRDGRGFSALQRAENSSILKVPTAQTQTR